MISALMEWRQVDLCELQANSRDPLLIDFIDLSKTTTATTTTTKDTLWGWGYP